ncbi:MAG: serine hydrolase [Pirellulaceae bacterium]
MHSVSLATAHAGEVAVSVRVLDDANNVTCHWNYQGQRVMPTASLIKLPIMLEAYRQAAVGAVSMDDMLTLRAEDQVPGSGILTAHFSPGLTLSLRDAVRLMIRYSDNTATNLVVDHIGLPSTSNTMVDLNWPETQLHSKVFRRDTSIDLQRSELYGLGSTTADDMTDLLVRLERGELVSPAACQAMLGHLLTCDDTTKLPRELPAAFTVAHKTGSVNRSRTAAGVVSGPGVKFAICVLTDKNEDTSWSDDNAAHVLIGRLARAVVDEVRAEATPHAEAAESNAGPQTRPMSVGASGPLVESLQRTLNARIEAGLGVDGDFGSATEAAVKKFQLANQLPETGRVDSATWLALGSLIEEDEPVPASEVVNSVQLPLAPALDVDAPPEVTATAWTSVDMVTGEVVGEVARINVFCRLQVQRKS